ncbi:4'-phosphopantetheinyl transferase superfamily protein [Cellulomonas sp.]|uniref:4'-phosphopantetheinyl transferase family protein n=1 Tax=Cellulomonas sp. TaxID=40001 RepID=UPI0025C0B817|nr:4'-phosphopantetheinyl transferase superfamily protein [Cellulomonas sp.]
MRSVLPAGVEVVEHVGPAHVAPLFPDEAVAVAGAVPARREEYAAVRACARAALGRLGLPPVSVPSAPDRAPIWPPGIVGCMTHCEGYRAAAVARADDWAGVGIDAETLAPLPDGVGPLVMSDGERAALADVDPATCPDRVLFSAKESVYKLWYPLVRCWLGFEEVEVRLGSGTFVARVGPDGLGVHEVHGRWAVHNGFVVTAVTLGRDLG